MFGERQPAQMYEDILSQVPLFHDLTKHELQVLSVNCRERDYPTGGTLLRQGETGIGLFIITSGKVQITQQAPDGSVRDLGTFERGAVLGEMSLLDDLPRTATAVALTGDCHSRLGLPRGLARTARNCHQAAGNHEPTVAAQGT
jgi:CRP-like cAMP-binding protein